MGLIVTHLSRRESKACCGEWGMETWKWGTLEDPGWSLSKLHEQGSGFQAGVGAQGGHVLILSQMYIPGRECHRG